MSDLHQGQVSERDVKSASARVAMDDLAGTVSGKLQVLFPAVGGWNIFFTPKVGAHVVTAKKKKGHSEGYILGTVYTGKKMPQGVAENIILMVSDDGKNFARFDADSGTLDVICDKKGTLKFKNLYIEVKELTEIKTKNLEIEVEEHTHIKTKTFHGKVEESAEIEVGEDVDITVGENVKAEVGGNVDTAIDGSVGTDVSGSVTTNIGGDITEKAGGTHTNNGAQTLHN